jgi:transcriptional regulator with XRE-family HTH domain
VGKSKADSGLVDRVREGIRSSGQSLNELGKKAGIDHGRLSRFVRGERDLTLSAAARLCAVLGLQLVKTGAATAPEAKAGEPRGRTRKSQ